MNYFVYEVNKWQPEIINTCMLSFVMEDMNNETCIGYFICAVKDSSEIRLWGSLEVQ